MRAASGCLTSSPALSSVSWLRNAGALSAAADDGYCESLKEALLRAGVVRAPEDAAAAGSQI